MPFANDLIDSNRERLDEQGVARLQSRFLFEPAAVMALLRSRIVGQDAVLAQVEAMLKVVKVDIGERERPLAVNLFMGPTGVGKTEIVRLLAQAIHGRADAMCRIDMHTLAQEHYAAALTGAPPGYVGSKEGTTLFDGEAIAGSFGRPGIVLFDELEKASPEVLRSLLGILEHGRLTLTAGSRTLDFRNSLIFMTSNVGAQQAQRYRERFGRGWRRWLGLAPKGRRRCWSRCCTSVSSRNGSTVSTASWCSSGSTSAGWTPCWRSNWTSWASASRARDVRCIWNRALAPGCAVSTIYVSAPAPWRVEYVPSWNRRWPSTCWLRLVAASCGAGTVWPGCR